MYPHEGLGSYVEGALRLLQFVEGRRPTGRRFGVDADARWKGFCGDLETADRIEMLVRDADAEWPAGFAARVVYAVGDAAEDEPFGASWPGLDPVRAEELWRRVQAEPAPGSVTATLRAIAAAWDITLAPHAVGAVTATDRLLVVGASAIAATIDAFAAGAGLAWAEQVLVVATAPAERQLAAAATSLLNAAHAGRLVTADEAAATAPDRGARLVNSPDAAPADLAAAHALLSR